MEFPRQEYWSGLPFPTEGDLPNPGIEPLSLASPSLITALINWILWKCYSKNKQKKLFHHGYWPNTNCYKLYINNQKGFFFFCKSINLVNYQLNVWQVEISLNWPFCKLLYVDKAALCLLFLLYMFWYVQAAWNSPSGIGEPVSFHPSSLGKLPHIIKMQIDITSSNSPLRFLHPMPTGRVNW